MKETRLTSKAKQDDREMKTTWNGVRSAAYKISSILYDLNKKGRLKLKKFNNDASKVANAVNEIFECELVSRRDVLTSYNNKRVGTSPPPRGQPPRLPQQVFKYICQLVFTANSIDQANCDPN